MDQQKIEVLIATKVWEPAEWVARLETFDTIAKVHVWPTDEDLSNVKALFVWKPLDQGVIERLPNLKWISSLGAGVDHLVGDKQIPMDIPITRIVDPYLTRDMTNYVIMGVMMYQRQMLVHLGNQKQKIWDRIPYHDLKIGVMGLGQLGAHCASQLANLGFQTYGYSRTPKKVSGVRSLTERELPTFLQEIDVLVNLLPVTPETESILNNDIFNQMKKGAYLINVARGNHLVEADLISALDKGQLSGALLDVFREEPLPIDNPLWSHPKITTTPHVASVSAPESVIKLLKANMDRLIAGEELLYPIDRKAGY